MINNLFEKVEGFQEYDTGKAPAISEIILPTCGYCKDCRHYEWSPGKPSGHCHIITDNFDPEVLAWISSYIELEGLNCKPNFGCVQFRK